MVINVRLNEAVRAVEVEVSIDGQRVRALIEPDALQARFNAGAVRDEWLKACNDNLPAVEAAIAKKWAAKRQEPFFLNSGDL